MKVLFLIMSHTTDDETFKNHKKVWDKIIDRSKEKDYPFEFLFLLSDENISDDYVVTGNSLVSKCVENYWDSLLVKAINGFDFFIKKDFTLVFKTNLSTLINLDVFYSFCLNLDSNREYIYDGFIGNYNDYKFASGAGMLLNKNSVNLILEHKNEISKEWTDDIFFGHVLHKKNKIEPFYGDLIRYDIIFENQVIDEVAIKKSTHIRIKIRKGEQDIVYTNKIYKLLYE